MGLFLFISILMAVEYIMQQIRIHGLKGEIGDLNDEVRDLKAKLYDKSQEEPELSLEEVNDGDEDEEEEEDED